MEDVKFNLNAIEKTFTKFIKDEIFDGVVITKRADGVVFNIGGKSDAFIEKEDFEDFDEVKIGDRFKVAVLGRKNEDGMVLVSKKHADDIIQGSLTIEKLKIGFEFSFYVTDVKNNNLFSKLANYKIIVPNDHIGGSKHATFYLNKQVNGIVTSIDKENKTITVSIKLLKDQVDQKNHSLFWDSIFINKIVTGVVEKIMPYGAFVNVEGVSCFIHISDISYDRIQNISDYLQEGNSYTFRIIKIDKVEKRVSLGIKQLDDNPKIKAIKNMAIGDVFDGVVVKILPFGAVVKLTNGVEGLLHVGDASPDGKKRIYEIIRLDDKVNVEVKSIDLEKNRVALKFVQNIN